MLDDLTELQKEILCAAAARPSEPIYCNFLLGERWNVKAGEKVFDGGQELEREFKALVKMGVFQFDASHYELTPEGRHLAANLLQTKRSRSGRYSDA